MPSHDHAERRQMIRKQREKGGSVYITAKALLRAGIDPTEPAPFYRVWASPRGRLVVQLYRSR